MHNVQHMIHNHDAFVNGKSNDGQTGLTLHALTMMALSDFLFLPQQRLTFPIGWIVSPSGSILFNFKIPGQMFSMCYMELKAFNITVPS